MSLNEFIACAALSGFVIVAARLALRIRAVNRH
ncbi:MAG: hypothetical protein QG549_692 [Patescibacteria group bacterium]|jgi:hypothetical protein|nr:hypothetical protein [Patescibacteria group bacterium]